MLALQDLSAKAAQVGFTTEECEYVTVFNKNRKKEMLLKRVFIHGVFRKPRL